jgi:AraC-like DNA-binding protein
MEKQRTEYKAKHFSFIECLSYCQAPNSEDEIHAHYDGAEIYEFLEGELYFAADGERIDIDRGDIVIITDGVLHRPVIKKECTYHRRRIPIMNRFFLDHGEGGMEIKKRLDGRHAFKISGNNVARGGCSRLISEIRSLLASGDTYSLFRAEMALISLLIKALDTKSDATPSVRGGNRERIVALLRYIDENIGEELSYRKLAVFLHASEKSLYKLLKSETGFTLSRYIKKRRIIIARSLLNSGSSPLEAGEKT